MMIPWFLIFFCFFIIVFQTRIKYNDRYRTIEKDVNKLVTDDISANFSRAQPIDDDMIIKIQEDALPFGLCLDSQVIETEALVKDNLKRPVINTGIESNIELKKRFGLKNLNTVIYGEENFTSLIKNLNNWARLLYENGMIKEAETVLVTAADSGSDISETFILLYQIYSEYNNGNKLNSLLDRVNALPDTARKRVLNVFTAKEDI